MPWSCGCNFEDDPTIRSVVKTAWDGVARALCFGVPTLLLIAKLRLEEGIEIYKLIRRYENTRCQKVICAREDTRASCLLPVNIYLGRKESGTSALCHYLVFYVMRCVGSPSSPSDVPGRSHLRSDPPPTSLILDFHNLPFLAMQEWKAADRYVISRTKIRKLCIVVPNLNLNVNCYRIRNGGNVLLVQVFGFQHPCHVATAWDP